MSPTSVRISVDVRSCSVPAKTIRILFCSWQTIFHESMWMHSLHYYLFSPYNLGYLFLFWTHKSKSKKFKFAMPGSLVHSYDNERSKEIKISWPGGPTTLQESLWLNVFSRNGTEIFLLPHCHSPIKRWSLLSIFLKLRVEGDCNCLS